MQTKFYNSTKLDKIADQIISGWSFQAVLLKKKESNP